MNHRILSLDVFRGITIFSMLIVNNPGSWGHIYPIFKHAKWNGFGGADWIFPFFLFIVGFAIPISISNYLNESKSKASIFFKILKRSSLLFLLGIFLNGFPEFNWETIRIPGVLQRIAVVYFLSACIFLIASRQMILILFAWFVFLHWIILTQIPNPDLGVVSLEVGNNISGWIDFYLLPNHLWIHSKTWDPEGILGTLPATASSLFGVWVGLEFLKEKKFTAYQLWFGFLLGILIICLSLLWAITFPVNKSLWTGSFVLLNSGLALSFFSLLYYGLDVSQSNRKSYLRVFELFGVNALAAFFLSSLFSKVLNIPFLKNSSKKLIGFKTYLYDSYFISNLSSYNASFAWALSYTMLWLLLFYILYKRKIFIKL